MTDPSAENKSFRQSATALGYDPDKDQAPFVIASGHGKIAEQIVNIARANQIPIHEDALLAETLAKININQAIPPELYLVIAQVFAYIQRVRSHLEP